MSIPRFHVTYEVTTPESAARGDLAEAGYIGRGEWHTNRGNPEAELSLREALDLAYPQEDCGRWFCEIDGRHDYQTGAVERRTVHPPRTITAASYNRLHRLLGIG
ncbi:hypothetical protein DFR49_0976 [Hephaestia caeni]|uniref:Uncharacterized protein n=1 Tax=Hephaestia caeni TaxID=645617 RepID=A0A397PJW4_9SPHN|nr:hypothetical protein [Hephaestia caeni]RIA46434.1 hypothetical protein DFR49_0976 [Hephaestia caeni]